MKINLYIVTYKNDKILNEWSLKTLFESDYLQAECEFNIHVINNHSEINIQEEYKDKVQVLENTLRPDFSTGHLARNWNQALIHGFRDLREPASDIVICCQNDVKFKKDWLQHLLKLHDVYSFVTYAQGDAFHSYTPSAVRAIGLWDERFCNICYQEHDYFIRALIYNKEKSSINSKGSRQLLNPCNVELLEIQGAPCGSKRGELSHNQSRKHSDISKKLFEQKWGVRPAQWPANPDWYPKKSKIQNYLFYPYFERDVQGLRDKHYLC